MTQLKAHRVMWLSSDLFNVSETLEPNMAVVAVLGPMGDMS